MRFRFFISSIICLTILFSLTGCMKTLQTLGQSKYFNKDFGMLDWDDENTIRVARMMNTNPKRVPEKQQKKTYFGSPLIRYDAVYDETEGLLFIYGKFWVDTEDVQQISYYTYDPNTRILLEATRLVGHYIKNSTPREVEKLKKLFSKENEAAMPPYFGSGRFFGYTAWYVFDDDIVEALKEQIDYAVKCKQENIVRDFLSKSDTAHLKWFDIAFSLFVDRDSIERLDSGSNIKTQMEIAERFYKKNRGASVHLYSQEMIKMLVGPIYFESLSADISQVQLDHAEEILAARLQKMQAEKEAKEKAQLKKDNPGLFATKERMLKFEASVVKEGRFIHTMCTLDAIAGVHRAIGVASRTENLKKTYNTDIHCHTGTGFMQRGSLKTTFDQWEAISQEINLGHLQYVVADNETRIKITDGTNYVSLYVDVSDLKNCHVVDAKLPDIGEHVFTIMGQKSAIQIKRNASIELLNVVYHKDFEQRGTSLIKFAENAILNVQARQEILDSGYELKRAGKL